MNHVIISDTDNATVWERKPIKNPYCIVECTDYATVWEKEPTNNPCIPYRNNSILSNILRYIGDVVK